MTFPLTDLPPELILHVIAFAACPHQIGGLSYSTSIAMASVSRLMYQLTMPHLLHTVACQTIEQLHLFIRSFRNQAAKKRAGAHLVLDYGSLVRVFWASEIWESLVENDNGIDYRAVYDIIHAVEILALSCESVHLLYSALSTAHGDPALQEWSCRKLVVMGKYWRWLPLTSSPECLAVLKQVTHLTAWLPFDLRHNIPFALMPALRCLTFPLLSASGCNVIIVHSTSQDSFMRWVKTGQWNAGTVELRSRSVSIDVERIWECGYLQLT